MKEYQEVINKMSELQEDFHSFNIMLLEELINNNINTGSGSYEYTFHIWVCKKLAEIDLKIDKLIK